MALSPIEGMLANLAGQLVGDLLSNPQALSQLGEMFDGLGCHSAADVAQDALDAYKAGHLTADQAMRIVAISLESGRNNRPVNRPTPSPVPSRSLSTTDLAALTERIRQQMMKFQAGAIAPVLLSFCKLRIDPWT